MYTVLLKSLLKLKLNFFKFSYKALQSLVLTQLFPSEAEAKDICHGNK